MNNNDSRATRYFLSAISLNPFLFRAWCWAPISVARRRSARNLTRSTGQHFVDPNN